MKRSELAPISPFHCLVSCDSLVTKCERVSGLFNLLLLLCAQIGHFHLGVCSLLLPVIRHQWQRVEYNDYFYMVFLDCCLIKRWNATIACFLQWRVDSERNETKRRNAITGKVHRRDQSQCSRKCFSHAVEGRGNHFRVKRRWRHAWKQPGGQETCRRG